MSRPSLRPAIEAMCKRCIHDPGAKGSWREQVAACSSADCPLHPLRPVSGSRTVARPPGATNPYPANDKAPDGPQMRPEGAFSDASDREAA